MRSSYGAIVEFRSCNLVFHQRERTPRDRREVMLAVRRIELLAHEPLPRVPEKRCEDAFIRNSVPPVVVGVLRRPDCINLREAHQRIPRKEIHPELSGVVLQTYLRDWLRFWRTSRERTLNVIQCVLARTTHATRSSNPLMPPIFSKNSFTDFTRVTLPELNSWLYGAS